MSYGLPAGVIKAATAQLKKVCMFYIGPNDNEIQFARIKSGKLISLDKYSKAVIERMPFQFSVQLIACGRDKLKQEYVKSVEVNPRCGCTLDQLTETIKQVHEDLLDSMPPKETCNAGWVATFSKHSFDERQTFELMKNNGAFDYLAEWQS